MRALLSVGVNGEVTLAGIAAMLIGVGSILSGVAAVITARRKGKDEADEVGAAVAVDEPRARGSGDGGDTGGVGVQQ